MINEAEPPGFFKRLDHISVLCSMEKNSQTNIVNKEKVASLTHSLAQVTNNKVALNSQGSRKEERVNLSKFYRYKGSNEKNLGFPTRSEFTHLFGKCSHFPAARSHQGLSRRGTTLAIKHSLLNTRRMKVVHGEVAADTAARSSALILDSHPAAASASSWTLISATARPSVRRIPERSTRGRWIGS